MVFNCESIKDHVDRVNKIIDENKVAIIKLSDDNNYLQVIKVDYDKNYTTKSEYTFFDGLFCADIVMQNKDIIAVILPCNENNIEIHNIKEEKQMKEDYVKNLRNEFRNIDILKKKSN